eukprot:jgi/Orpsp1_1/1177026/evm.model.c7180000059882.1
MKINYLLKGVISSAFLYSLTIKAQEHNRDCKEIEDIGTYCIEDKQGNLIQLDINNDDKIGDKEWERLLSYKTVKELKLYNIKKGYNQKIIDKIGSLTNLEILDIGSSSTFDKNLNFDSFQNLTKLKELFIGTNEDNVIEKNIIKSFKSVNELNLYDVKLDKNAISELSSLTKIGKLNLGNITFEKNIDYDFKNVNELEITTTEINKNFFASFKNLKKLTLWYELDIKQSHIDEISTISTLEEIDYGIKNSGDDIDLNVFKNLKNLKR